MVYVLIIIFLSILSPKMQARAKLGARPNVNADCDISQIQKVESGFGENNTF